MVVIRGRLEPEVGAVVLRALEAAREALHQRAREAAGAATAPESPGVYPFDTSAETPSPAAGGPTAEQRQADALALVAETALHHGIAPVGPGERPLPEVPPPPAVPPDPVGALRAQSQALGLTLTARTALPLWYRERLDVGWAIDVLHPLANPGADLRAGERVDSDPGLRVT